MLLRVSRLRVVRAFALCVLLAIVALPGQALQAASGSFTLIGRADGGVRSGQHLALSDTLVIVSNDSGVHVRYTIDLRWVRDSLPKIDQDDEIEVEIQLLPDGTLVASSIENVSGRSGTENQGQSTGSQHIDEQPDTHGKEEQDRPEANAVSTDLTATPTSTATATSTATRTASATAAATPTRTATPTITATPTSTAMPTGTATATLTSTVTATGTATPTATSTATSTPTPTATNTPVPHADLALAKNVSNAAPNLGDTIIFTVTLTNLGPNTATGVQVTDLLPPGLTFVSATPSQGTYSSLTGLWSVGSVTTSTARTLQIQATVASPSGLTNTASVTHSDLLDPVSSNNAASVTETPKQADLALSNVASDSAPNVGNTITFTVTLTNGGPGTATGVQVTDMLPSDLTFVSAATSQGTYSSLTGLWNVGTVTTATPQTLRLQATVTSSSALTNTATVTASNQLDPSSANNAASATEKPKRADLALSKIVSTAAPNVGGTITFTVTLSNNGPDQATNVQVTDLLPAGLSFVSSSTAQGSYSSVTGIWNVGTVTTTTPLRLMLNAQVTNTSALTNTATISHSDQFDPSTANNAANASETPQQADLVLDFSASLSSIPVSLGSVLTLTVRNTGPDTATNITITMVKGGSSPGSGILSYIGLGRITHGGYTPATGVWSIGTLGSGETATLEFQVIGLAAGTPVTDTATITHSDQFDPNTSDNSDSVTVTVIP